MSESGCKVALAEHALGVQMVWKSSFTAFSTRDEGRMYCADRVRRRVVPVCMAQHCICAKIHGCKCAIAADLEDNVPINSVMPS